MRLTLRTLLAYLDDTLPAAEAADLGRRLAATPEAQALADRLKAVSRRRSLPPPTDDANTTADYLSNVLTGDALGEFEAACLADDARLAEVAACHQVLSLVLTEQVRVPPTARTRMYGLVKGREAVPGRKPAADLSVAPVRDADPAADDTADAHLLLGLPAYSAAEPAGRRAARLGAVAALLAGCGLCAFLAWPGGDPDAVVGRPAAVVSGPAVPAAPAGEATTPMPPAVAAATPTVTPSTPAAEVAPPPSASPPPAPKADRLALGQFDRPAGGAPGLLVRRRRDAAEWERVPTDPNGVFATDRLVCLPGFRAALKLESGATLDLWGNLPELVPVPVLQTAVTLALPEDGRHADLQVHAGRVYLGGRNPNGVTVRLRFADQVWDVSLPDDKAEAVFELVPLATPGEKPAPPTASARVVTLAGPATVTPAGGPAVKLDRGAGLGWATGASGPQPLPPLDRGGRDQLAKLSPVSPAAQPTVAALAALAARPADGPVAAALDELLQPTPDTAAAAPRVVAGYRVAVYGSAALGRTDTLVDLLTSPANPAGRQTAAMALVPALAAGPELAGPVRTALITGKNLSPAEADEVFRLLRGVSLAERADPATLDRLLADLQSGTLPLRELALSTLIGLADPDERPRVTAPPFAFDVGGPEETRQAGERAWKRRVDDLKKRLEKGPAPKLGRDTGG